MPDIAVRPVERADMAAWRRLWDGYNAFYGRSGPTALAESIVETTWARFFDADEPMAALVAETGGRLAGLAHIVFHRSMTSPTSVCYLQDLFTDPASRGQGVGRALIEAVYRRAAAAGATRVYWQTHESNATAMRLYDAVAERTGFVVYAKRF
jgi:GNAT superfamily N-acetyltransferase